VNPHSRSASDRGGGRAPSTEGRQETGIDEEPRPDVSVVMPFLDPPLRFFREAIESVFGQTVERWELLLVNDGSGPEPSRYAEEVAAAHPGRVRVLAHPGRRNRGIAASRQLGLEHASARWLAFLDADDVWLPGRIERHLELLGGHPDAMTACSPSLYWTSWRSGEDVPGPGDTAPGFGVEPRRLLPSPGLLPIMLSGLGAVPCTSGITIDRQALLALGGVQQTFPGLYEDQALYVTLFLSYPSVTTDEVLDLYRQHPGSVMGSTDTSVERLTRRAFLEWVLERIEAQAPAHPQLVRVVRSELRALDRPALATIRRRLRKLRYRVLPRTAPPPGRLDRSPLP